MPNKLHSPQWQRSIIGYGVYLLIGTLLMGCVHNQTRPAHFYTLIDASHQPPDITSKTNVAVIDILPIEMPARFKRPQLVVNVANSKEIRILEQVRWASSFNDEFRDALKSAINQDAHATVSPRLAGQVPAYRVGLTIAQLSAVSNDKITASIALTIASLADGTTPSRLPLTCQINLQQTVATGNAALVAGYQSLVDKLADYILENIHQLSTATAPTCVASAA